MIWKLLHPLARPETLGFIPTFLSENDPRPAFQQFHEHYIGGWFPFSGFTLQEDGSLKYAGDPPLLLLAETKLRDETIRLYQYAWIAIIQPDGTHEIARMD